MPALRASSVFKEGSDDLALMPKSALAASRVSSKIEGHSSLTKCEHFPTTSGKA